MKRNLIATDIVRQFYGTRERRFDITLSSVRTFLMENYADYLPFMKDQRFKAQERALVSFPLDSEDLPYHIIDICEGGLSFRYLGKKIKASKIPLISLYYEYELIVEDLPVKEVSDYQLSEGIVPVRRKSLRFESLSIEQHNRLSFFIERFKKPSSDKTIHWLKGNMAVPSCLSGPFF